MSAGEMAAIIAVFELPPKFSRNNQVSTESRYGMKSAFFDFLLLEAYGLGRERYNAINICSVIRSSWEKVFEVK